MHIPTQIDIQENYFNSESHIKNSIWDVKKEYEEEIEYKRRIIKLFLDNLRDEEAPFSIQNFVEHGYARYKRMPGEWYGVNSAANVMEDINSYYKPERTLEIIIFNDLGISPKKWAKKAEINWTWKVFKKESLDDEDYDFLDKPKKVRNIILLSRIYHQYLNLIHEEDCKISNENVKYLIDLLFVTILRNYMSSTKI